ncbi:serpin family protein [Candidatus Uabimicrobium sp. HlEnr_7]|uniref:serpin family protein n=1 Tax=Candidatus Uabimicrobium helgolandensis TaxID=3095367 RepID=UPI0035572F2D
MKKQNTYIGILICILMISCVNDLYNRKLSTDSKKKNIDSNQQQDSHNRIKNSSKNIDIKKETQISITGNIIDVSNEDTDELAKNNTNFAWNLYRQLADSSSKNIFFSPYSVSTALAMTYSGAREQTREEMKTALNFTLPDAKLHRAFSNLIDKSQSSDNYKFNVANSIWVHSDFSLEKAFIDTLDKNYRSSARKVDFVRATEYSRLKINSWVEEKTNKKIKNLLEKNVITPDTRLVLTNAIYFKGQWAMPFDNGETRKRKFFGQKESNVDMMSMTNYFLYHEDRNLQAIELPYEGNSIVAIILLPNPTQSFTQSIDSFDINAFLANAKSKNIHFTIPKFKLVDQRSLNKPLEKMGMKQAFSSSKANFSGIAKKPLVISEIIHKAFIEFDEKGTEAAAATAVAYSTLSYVDRSEDYLIRFNANRPFVFLIFDKQTKSTLFLGRIMEL